MRGNAAGRPQKEPAGKGLVPTAAAFAIWGLFPLYFYALRQVSAVQIIAHRLLWSCLFVCPRQTRLRRTAVCSMTLVLDASIARCHSHRRRVVGEVQQCPGGLDRERAPGIEAEAIDPRPVVDRFLALCEAHGFEY